MDRGRATGRAASAGPGPPAGHCSARAGVSVYARLAAQRRRGTSDTTRGIRVRIFSEGSRRMRVLQAMLLTVIVAAGCAPMGPNYQRPDVETPSQFKESGTWKYARPADHLPRGAWWTVFGDATLNRLENQAAAQNPNL